MKALVIAPQPFFSPRGTPFSVYYRTLVAAEFGVQIDFLTYGEGEDVDIPGIRIIRIPRLAFLGSVRTGPSLLKLFLDSIMVLWTILLLLRYRYDFVHAHEEAVFFCRFLKPIFGFRLVYDMHSSLPQQLMNFQFTKSKTVVGLFEKLEKDSLRAADAIITISPALLGYANRLIREDQRHFLIENSIFEPIRLSPSSVDCRNDRHSSEFHQEPPELPKGRRFVVYTGSLERYQGIDILIAAFCKVVAGNPDVFLVIVGGTRQQVGSYSAVATSYGLGPNCLFTGSVSPSLASHYCHFASVLISPRCRGTNTPLKIYEYLASGVPVVATNISSHTQVLNDEIAYLVDPEPGDMARGILSALNSDGESRRIAMNAKRLYEQKYSRRAYEKKMQQFLEFLGRCVE